jgi:hypothetical protein
MAGPVRILTVWLGTWLCAVLLFGIRVRDRLSARLFRKALGAWLFCASCLGFSVCWSAQAPRDVPGVIDRLGIPGMAALGLALGVFQAHCMRSGVLVFLYPFLLMAGGSAEASSRVAGWWARKPGPLVRWVLPLGIGILTVACFVAMGSVAAYARTSLPELLRPPADIDGERFERGKPPDLIGLQECLREFIAANGEDKSIKWLGFPLGESLRGGTERTGPASWRVGRWSILPAPEGYEAILPHGPARLTVRICEERGHYRVVAWDAMIE